MEEDGDPVEFSMPEVSPAAILLNLLLLCYAMLCYAMLGLCYITIQTGVGMDASERESERTLEGRTSSGEIASCCQLFARFFYILITIIIIVIE